MTPRRGGGPPAWLVVRRVPMTLAEGGKPPRRQRLRTPGQVADLLRPYAETELVEVFWIVCLDSHHAVTDVVEVTRGLLNCSLVHPRETFRPAILAGAAGIILSHNHPSGDPSPSDEDRAITRQLVAAGRLLDIPVLDHVILGDGRHFSMAEGGML